jgi:hypothetical protein
MDPKVPGYGIPAGGRVEIEMGKGFERNAKVPFTQKAIMVVTGVPNQGMPGKAVGYKIQEGMNPNIILVVSKAGLPVHKAMSPAPGAKNDPIRSRGIKVFHVGFLKSPFINRGQSGEVKVRFVDAAGKIIHEGGTTVNFARNGAPEIHPNNFLNKRANHNWQRIKPGQTLGKTGGTLALTPHLYAKPGVPPLAMIKFKTGVVGAGVLSTPQLRAMGFSKPKELARYNGGLIVQDTNGDGMLDPEQDRIIGGVIAMAPSGAKGQELRSLERNGKPVLSRPMKDFSPQLVENKPPFAKLFGGSIMQLQFRAGNKAGKYRPTLALLRDPYEISSGDGSSFTYTIVVQ